MSNLMMTANQAAQWLPGSRLEGQGQAAILRVNTDTRTITINNLNK